MKPKSKKRIFKFSILVILLWLAGLFNPISNLHFLVSQTGQLKFKAENDVNEKYNDELVNIKKVSFERTNNGGFGKLLNVINHPRLWIITFKENDHNFTISYSEQGLTSRTANNGNSIFSVNSNFYDTDQKSLGEIIINGKKLGYTTNSSGYFKVIDGKALVGPRSLFENINGTVEYSCQAHPSVMKDGVIWPYILNESLNNKTWGRKTYRNLSGIDRKGNVVFLLSADGALLSVKEMSELALQLGIETATLFDAGSSLQYSIKAKGFKYHFSAYNNQLNLGFKVDNWFKEKLGYRFYNSAPVFINYISVD